MISIFIGLVVIRRCRCYRLRHRKKLLTGSRCRLTILEVVAEKVDIVADIGRSKIRDLEVWLPDGLWLTSDVLDARQRADIGPIGHFIPAQVIDFFFRIVATSEKPANVVVAAHTFRNDLLDKIAENESIRNKISRDLLSI